MSETALAAVSNPVIPFAPRARLAIKTARGSHHPYNRLNLSTEKKPEKKREIFIFLTYIQVCVRARVCIYVRARAHWNEFFNRASHGKMMTS